MGAGTAFNRLQCLYDLCVVRSPQVQIVAAGRGDSCELGNRAIEYTLQVPANRIGYGYYTASQLKTIQEVITLTVFVFFSMWYLQEPIRWNIIVGFVFLLIAAFFIFHKWE